MGATRLAPGPGPGPPSSAPEPGSTAPRRGPRGWHAAGGPLVWPPGRGGAHRRRPTSSALVTGLVAVVLPSALVVVGAAVRLEQLAAHRSLWPDEAMLAANIVHRGFAGLLRPLAFQQAAPVGFLWAERAAVLVLGNNEYALVLLPLVAGLASLVLAWEVGRRLLSPLATAALLVLVCLNPGLVFYATEAKQYSLDLACSLAVVLVAMGLPSDGPPYSRRRLGAFAVVGAVVVWLSHAAVLVAATLAVVVVLRAALARRRRDVLAALAAALVVGLSLATDYVVFLGRLSQDGYLRSYWAAGFVPDALSPASVLAWLGRAALALVANPAGLGPRGLVVALAVVGAAVVIARRRWAAVALASIGLAALAGALSGRYPVEGRLGLFVMPLLLASVAGAIDVSLLGDHALGRWRAGAQSAGHRRVGRHTRAAHRASRGRGGGAGMARVVRVAAVGLVALVAARPLAGTAAEVAHPIRISEVRPVLAFVKAHLRPGDAVYLDSGAGDVWDYYAPLVGLRMASTVLLPASRGGTCTSVGALLPPTGDRRLWMVFGYHLSFAPSDEHRIYLARLALVGRQVLRHRAAHASVYLFDLRRHPVHPARRLPSAPGVRCLVPFPQPPVAPTGLHAGPLGTGRLT